jgi:hypothetical protein
MPTSTLHFRDLLHTANLRHGTHGFTSLPKEGVLRIFPPLKIRRLRPGLNPWTWVPEASTLTPRPPKPLSECLLIKCRTFLLWSRLNAGYNSVLYENNTEQYRQYTCKMEFLSCNQWCSGKEKSNAHSETAFLIQYPVRFLSVVGYFTYITSCVFDYIFLS